MKQYVNYITILPEAIVALVGFVVMIDDAYTRGR